MTLRLLLTIGFLLSLFNIKAQVKYHELKGVWITYNADNQYYRSDTLRFLNTSERLFCDNVVWNIDRPSEFYWSKCDCCNEPPRITVQTKKQRLKLENGVLYYFVGTDLLERFKILDLSYCDYKPKAEATNARIKQLTVIRLR